MAGPIITIYCDGPEGDRHDRYVVDQYQQHRVGDRLAWLPLEQWTYRGVTGRSAEVTQRYLLADEPVERTPDPDSDSFRMQLTLRCPRCNFNERRDLDRGGDVVGLLFAALDRMVDGGADEIPARTLAQLIFRVPPSARP